MTDSLRLMGSAVTLGDMQVWGNPLYGDRRKPKPPLAPRCCPCGTVLSRHNTSDTCYPCQDRAHAAGVIEMTQTKAEKFLEERLNAAIEVARTLTPQFSCYQFAIAMNVRAPTAQGVLRQLHQRGQARIESRQSNKNGKQVAMWSLT